MEFLLIPLFAISASVGLWCAITWFLSQVAGWPRLRKLYALTQPFEGNTTVLSGKLGATMYRSTLIAGGDWRGLYLNVVIFFRLGTAPVFIPWSDIQISEPSGWRPWITLEFPRARTRLRLAERTATQLLAQRDGIGAAGPASFSP